MSQIPLDKINKVFLINLKAEDLAKQHFSYYTGYIQKGKGTPPGYRIMKDAIIEIPGIFSKYAIGIRSYKIDDFFKQKTFYLAYWKEKNHKRYAVKDPKTPFNSIIDTFEAIYSVQKYYLPCFEVYVNYKRYIELLANVWTAYLYDTVKDMIIKINQDKLRNIERVDLDINECIPLYETVMFYHNGENFTVKEFLLGDFLAQYAIIIEQYHNIADKNNVTRFFTK